ncbi:CHST9 [Mytilus coruscus]|uniref:Carbohydrate sulfotransferase n=1 Tax=Mytilus coruscus TaxID=42192 RepID=A0A6J8AD79_MYTCO|nr:CHST9 [Mytilus coruscus]
MKQYIKRICRLTAFCAIIFWLLAFMIFGDVDNFDLNFIRNDKTSTGERQISSRNGAFRIIRISNKTTENLVSNKRDVTVVQLTHEQLFNQNIKTDNIILQDKHVPRLTAKEMEHIKHAFENSPIVLKKYKLIFFWNEKSGCTYWKSLFYFIQGLKNTDVHNSHLLSYLVQFNHNEITEMIFDNSWTKAVFVREPRERILSCYLDKGFKKAFMVHYCKRTPKSFLDFLKLIKQCKGSHWEPQVKVPKFLYKNMMIGKMSDIFTFTEQLLTKIGAWNETVNVWMNSEKIEKRARPHATNAKDKLFQYYNDTKVQDLIFEMYADDYDVFNFEKKYFDFNKNLQKR